MLPNKPISTKHLLPHLKCTGGLSEASTGGSFRFTAAKLEL